MSKEVGSMFEETDVTVPMCGFGSSGLSSAGALPVKGSLTVYNTLTAEANYS